MSRFVHNATFSTTKLLQLFQAQAAEAAYAFILGSDSLLVEPKTLQSLIEADKPAVAPMLRDFFSNERFVVVMLSFKLQFSSISLQQLQNQHQWFFRR